jgi:hypothetical protein
MKRNADDNATRIFMKHYRKDTNHYSYDLQAVYEEIDHYGKLIDIWAAKLPPIYTIVSYEELVEKPDVVLGEIARLCGIPGAVGKVPIPPDDRGCAKPYQRFLSAQRKGTETQARA